MHLEYYDGQGNWNDVIASTPTGGTGTGDGSYLWPSVGVAKSAGCKLRVTDVDDGTVTKESGTFSIWPVITVSEPLSGANVAVKSNNTDLIVWHIDGDSKIGNVNIKYDINSGGDGYNRTVQDNVVVTGADQSYTWNNVPVTPRSSNVKIKVIDVDDSGDLYSGVLPHTFNIVGSLVISQPDGTDWKILTGYNVIWSDSDGVANVSAYYSTEDGAATTYTLINTVPAANGSMPWTTPDQVTDDGTSKIAKVKIIDASEDPNVDTAVVSSTSAQFNLIEDFTNIQPSSGTPLTAGENTSITWSGLGNSLATVELYLIDDIASTETHLM